MFPCSKIATDYAEQIAIQDLHAMFIETSAKTGENVEEVIYAGFTIYSCGLH